MINQLTISNETLQGISELAERLNLSINELLEQIVHGKLAVIDKEELEDLLDLQEAILAEADPDNQERISWEAIKKELNL
ncbi:MAG: hypothetical protein VKJ02_06770 [Snowella sp.]|nr:hypothetical protein [Snowella sp.]